MRVTNLLTTQQFIDQIFKQREALQRTQQELSSGIRIASPSDDPGRAGTIQQFNNTLQRLGRHKERIAYATNILSQQENTLNSAESLMLRAKELASQAANETNSVEARALIAEEVWQLRDNMVALANTTIQGRYIYGAADDDDPPFDSGSPDYTNPATATDPAHLRYEFDAEDGTASTRSVAISDSLTVQVNTPGDQVFSNSIAALERLGRALSGYRTTPEDLSTLPDGGGVAFNFPTDFNEQTSDIQETIDLIESARTNDIVTEISSVGGRLARVELAQGVLETVTTDTQNARSTIQDTDVYSAASNFTLLQTSLEATLASGSQLTRLSLLDFI